jgi:hypothetical protein
MLFWACKANLENSISPGSRFFPGHLLKDEKHDYDKLKTSFPNEKFKHVVQQVLRKNYVGEESNHYNRLCDIFESMYVSSCFFHCNAF